MATATDLLMARFAHALNSPIHNRCAELTVLIDRSSSKDLQNLFPSLIENIFGTTGGVSWGIRNINSTSNAKDFEILHHFLGPLGPMFRLIYKLLTDCQVKFEFSVQNLPNKVRHTLEHSKVPPFYIDLINVDSQTRKVYSLSLNAFDFYMFHFAYHLTNPWQQRVQHTWSTWNTVYYVLSCDYMIHFLPLDPNIVVLPQLQHFTGKNPIVVAPQSVTVSRPQRTSKLLLSHVLQQSSTDISTLHQPIQQHPRSEIWRSETVIQVFIDMWLNNDQFNTGESSINPQAKMNDLPSGEYIRILRVLVKQLHAFSASGKNDSTSLGDLKKIVQPMLQGKMYAFLRHLVYRWPLDGSFRLVLELWLSFIQPWRYLPENFGKNPDIDLDEKDLKPVSKSTKIVEPEYMGFIAENLLAYTVIFQQLLTRFSRVDLASPKNSLMLFRVTKVFGQPNLVPMISEIESLVNLNSSPSHSYNANFTSYLPPLSPTSCWSTNTTLNISQTNLNESYDLTKSLSTSFDSSQNISEHSRANIMNNKWSAVVRHRIYEWEGPEFCYKPIFANNVAPEIFQLLNCIQNAENIATETIRIRTEEAERQNSGFSGFLKSLFYIEENSDEFTLDERKKVTSYLAFAKQNLIDIFKLNPNNLQPMDKSNLNESFETSMSYRATPVKANLDFSPLGSKLRAKMLKYEGDPDLHPIRTTENGFLVRILYHAAQKINNHYYDSMQRLYHRNDFLGKISRQVLLPPQIAFSYDKTLPGHSPRVKKTLPARISFRYFASHTFLTYAFVILLFMKFIGYSPIFVVFFAFFIWFMLIIIRAIVSRSNSCNNNFVEPLDQSFNDSF